ncbi:MAG: UvrB/UvrC motif-containing protein [Planctomycetes bacterium]|nr:UvrB/UvrC motif-containing protein [Planctomycetota bacterium]
MQADHEDLSPLLESWKYEEGNNIRRIQTPEGREVIQVRLPLGIEQYEVRGRPDGSRPAQCESWLERYEQEAARAPWEFRLDEEAFENLRQESLLYYQRYLLFFQISDYELCARDTLRNLRVCDFVAKYASPALTESLEQYRPYILRMHVMAKALWRIQTDGSVVEALDMLQEGMDQISSLPPLENNPIFQLEQSRSLKSLEDLHRQLSVQIPRSPADALRDSLKKAIDEENYEEAARIRDQISRLSSRPHSKKTGRG